MTLGTKMRMLAYAWHSGQNSPLYSFASTGAVIHDEGHRQNLVTEVEENITWCEAHPATHEADDLPNLRQLLAFVQVTPLNLPPAPFPTED